MDKFFEPKRKFQINTKVLTVLCTVKHWLINKDEEERIFKVDTKGNNQAWFTVNEIKEETILSIFCLAFMTPEAGQTIHSTKTAKKQEDDEDVYLLE